MRKNISTVVEITDTHVKLLQAKHARGQKVICACESQELAGPSEEAVVKGLKEMLPRAAHPFKEVAAVIPRRLVILKQMRLPSHHDREIRKMIGLQLVNQIPYPPDDVVYDHLLLEKEPSGYARVMVVIVHKDVSSRYGKIFKDAGLSPREFVLSSCGLAGWLSYQQGRKKFSGEGAVMLVNADTSHLELCFCQNGKLLFSRSLLYGGKDLGGQDRQGLVRQVELTRKNYLQEKMGPAPLKGIILAAGKDGLALKTALEEALDLPFEAADACDGVPFQKNISPSKLKEPGMPSLAVGLGALLSDLKGELNLVPKEVAVLRGLRLKNIQRVKTGFLVALLLILTAAIGAGRSYKKAAYFKELEARSAEIEPAVKAAKQKIRLLEFLEGQRNKRPVVSDVVLELMRLMPEDVSLRSIALDGLGRWNVQGYAQAGPSVNNFQAGMVRSPAFTEVNLEYATKRKIFNMEVTDFKISFRPSGAKEEK